jgi:hypothetical protein
MATAVLPLKYDPNDPRTWSLKQTEQNATQRGIGRPAEKVPIIGPVIKGERQLSNVIEALFDYHLWLRIAEGTVGLVLIIIGTNKLFNMNIGGKVAQHYA